MSKLRKQLEQAKADYESERYPGNLADEVLGRRLSIRTYLAIGLSLAASVAIVIGLLQLMPGNTETIGGGGIAVVPSAPISVPTTAPAFDTPEVAVMPAEETMPELPTFPTDVPSMPSLSTESLSSFPAVPSMPDWNSTDTSSAKEQT
jgi:hypothetical protein